MMKNGRIAIIGAGPGGLAAAMILAARGMDVTIYEKQPYVGGRTSSFTDKGFTFDLGPTFFSMPYILEEIFDSAGRNLHDYVTLHEIAPMYTLKFDDMTIQASREPEKMKAEIARLFPGDEHNYDRFMSDTRRKMGALTPILQTPFPSLLDYMRPRTLRALPELELGKTLYDVLSNYFDDDRLKLSFTFQSKYLGMSPWECPGAFSILSFMEHEWGIYHPAGGLNQLTKAMAAVVEEYGGTIHLNTGVKQFVLDEKRRVKGIELDSGETVDTEHVIMNADFADGISKMIPDAARKKYRDADLAKKKYSCSTFMIYAGLSERIPLDHHTILFAEDYKKNVEEISDHLILSDDPSIYVQHASATDESVAPAGKSALYILAPVPNNFSGIDWEGEKETFRQLIWKQVAAKAGIDKIEELIETETVLTPADWQQQKHVFQGATFNLAHNLRQMMYFRPHNQYEDVDGLWLVGGGTHPGSGLPTIFESGRITANLLTDSYKKTARKEEA
ncbi:phytoene desaturase [Salisediminibacterium halotolerans]|uniref:Phytoene desaturase n=2 Tax=Salisediminibacterium halotolerans TaxID=517425 RepID=A0A1H9PB38_9BACI|nr:phytoene desaturase [Salisediminibacterium haloalkalitolerans]